MDSSTEILSVLDRCCDNFTFPMLDNGYVYLAATRLSLFRSDVDWALVIEVFGFMPRSGLPDTSIYTFASRLHDRDTPGDFVTREAYENYLTDNPHNESRAIFPIAEGPWQSAENAEVLAKNATVIPVRGQMARLPSRNDYKEYGISLEDPNEIYVFEACRYLAATHRDIVLATDAERRISVPPDLDEILVLDEWSHPDIVDDSKLPSSSETFQQLATVLATGNTGAYSPTMPPNTHWSNWPDGGTL